MRLRKFLISIAVFSNEFSQILITNSPPMPPAISRPCSGSQSSVVVAHKLINCYQFTDPGGTDVSVMTAPGIEPEPSDLWCMKPEAGDLTSWTTQTEAALRGWNETENIRALPGPAGELTVLTVLSRPPTGFGERGGRNRKNGREGKIRREGKREWGEREDGERWRR